VSCRLSSNRDYQTLLTYLPLVTASALALEFASLPIVESHFLQSLTAHRYRIFSLIHLLKIGELEDPREEYVSVSHVRCSFFLCFSPSLYLTTMSDNRATQVLVRAWLDSHEPASSLSSPSRNVRSPSAPIDHDPLHNGSLLTAGWQAPPTWLNLLDAVDKLVDIMDWGQASDDILNWRTSVIVPLSSGWRHFDKEAKDGVLHVLKGKHAYLAQHLKEFKELHHDGRHPNGPRTLFGGWIVSHIVFTLPTGMP